MLSLRIGKTMPFNLAKTIKHFPAPRQNCKRQFLVDSEFLKTYVESDGKNRDTQPEEI